MHTLLRKLSLAGALALPLACHVPSDVDPGAKAQPITPLEAALIVDSSLEEHFTDIAETVRAFDQSGLVGDAFGHAGCGYDAAGEPITGCADHANVDFRDDAHAATTWLRDHAFAEGNVEEDHTTESRVTFRMRPEQLCPAHDGDRDPDCVAFFTRTAFRIAVTRASVGSVNLAFTVDAAAPGSAVIGPAGASVTSNLPEIRKALQIVARHQGEERLLADLPETFEGVVKTELTRDATRRYRFAVSILAPVRVGDNAADPLAKWLASVGTGDNVVAFTLDGDARKMLGSLDFKAIDVEAALNLLAPRHETCPEDPEVACTPGAPRAGVAALHLGGLNVATTFDARDDHFSLRNVGLGDDTSTITVDGARVLSADLNKNAGRRFGLDIERIASGHGKITRVAVTPSFGLRVEHDVTSLVSRFDVDEIPAWAQKGFFEVTLDGSAPMIEEVPRPPMADPTCDSAGNCVYPEVAQAPFFKVASGRFSASAPGVNVVVQAPSCLVAAKVEPVEGAPQPHPLSVFSSGSCE